MLKRTTELTIKILNNTKTEILKALDEIKEIVVPIEKNLQHSEDIYNLNMWIKNINEEVSRLQDKLQILKEEAKINGEN